ncbi:AsmA family protein [Ahrensia kielensis]|uniref:AsmA family protein n=1 Tax=Ahrensia kielensis TaxID=76980 RepID=UPI00035D9F7C|nr:AsmA family protein [Ahrensia kielensis]
MRLFVLIGGMIVLVLLAALVGPYFVDWSGYRDRFEAEASRILGQEVRVEGSASARLVPFPSVTFSDVRVGPKNAPNVTVEKFSMDVELAPFLRGEILIFDMNFVSPVVRLDLDEDGKPQWDFPLEAPVDPAQIILEQASFSDGTIVVRDQKTARQWDFVSLNGTAAAQSLFGPWRVESKGFVRGEAFEARISTGNLNREGFSARIQAMLPESKFELISEGRIAAPSTERESWYSGTFSIKPTAKRTQNYLIEGLFEADARSLKIEQFRGDFGALDDPYTINGTAEIDGGEIPSFNFQAKGNQVSFNDAADGEGAPVSLSNRLAEIQSVLAALPIPSMAGTIELDLPTIVAGSTTIRDLTLRAEPKSGAVGSVWDIKRLEAKLPGRTVLEGSGTLVLGEGEAAAAGTSFKGDLVVASRQPSGLAAWLTDDIDETIRMMPNAGFSAQVELNAEQQIFSELELVLGAAQLTGRIERKESASSMPYISVDLAGDNARYETLDALSRVLFGAGSGASISGHDIDATFDLTNPHIKDLEMGALEAALRVRGERVEVDKLSIRDIFGAAVSATGTLSGLEDQVGYNTNFDVSLIAAQGAPFMRGLARIFPNVAFLDTLQSVAVRDAAALQDTSLNVVGTALLPADDNGEVSVSVSGQIGGSDISLTTTITGALLDPEKAGISLSGTVSNPEASILLSQAGFDVLPLRLLGEGQVKLNALGNLVEGLSTRFSLQTLDSFGSAEGVLKQNVSGLDYVGAARVQSKDAEPWMDVLGYVFPATGLGTPLVGEARITLQDGRLALSDLSGQVADNNFAGNLTIANERSKRLFEGTLKLSQLDLGFLAEILTGRYDLSDEASLFSNPLYTDNALDVRVSAENLTAMENSATAAQLRLIYRDNALSLREIQAALFGGNVTGSLDAQNDNGAVLFNSNIRLQNADLTHFATAPLSGVEANGAVTLSLTGAGNSTKALVNSLAGSGVIATDNLILSGLNGEALPPVLDAADEIGYQITDAQITNIAAMFIPSGSVSLPPLELPVSVNNGRLSIDNIAVQLDHFALNGAFSLALGEQAMSGEARITYDVGDDIIAGSQPEVVVSMNQAKGQEPIIVERDYALLTSFIRQRALEREQARVEALQARLLEKQRLRRQVRYLKYLQRENFVRSEEERLREIAAKRLAVILERRRQEQRVLEAQQILDEQKLLEEAERQRIEAERKQAEEQKRAEEAARRANEEKPEPLDDGLTENPFGPRRNDSNLFQDLEFDSN